MQTETYFRKNTRDTGVVILACTQNAEEQRHSIYSLQEVKTWFCV